MKLRGLAGALAAAGLIWAAVEAGTTIVSRDGDLVGVEVVTNQGDPTVQGLRVTTVTLSGQRIDEVIESTLDSAADVGPSIELAPFDDQPVVIWSRMEGSDFELAIAHRSASTGWPVHALLTSNTGSDSAPQFAIDASDRVHVLWWSNGAGAPLSFQCFSSITAEPLCPLEDPFNPRRTIRPRTPGPPPEGAGGLDDPGVITGRIVASADHCVANPSAEPEHGVVATCATGRPAVYQYSGCVLTVGIYDARIAQWKVTNTNLATADLNGTSVRDIVEGMLTAACH